LLDRGADPNQADTGGTSALQTACMLGNLPAIDLLLAKGADPNLMHNGVTGFKPIHCAGFSRKYSVVRYLIEKCHQPYDVYLAAGWGDVRGVHERTRRRPSLADTPLGQFGKPMDFAAAR